MKVFCGNAIDVLKKLPDESVQCCITSSPYWGLRCYGTQPQIWKSDLPLCNRHQWIPERKNTQHIKGGSTCKRCNAWRGELGLEPTPDLFIKHLVQIFHEVKRVLRNDGTFWFNLGDTYAGSSQGWGQKEEHLSPIQKGNKGSLHSLSHPPVNYRIAGLKSKDLCGIPWRTALALQADGWYLRSDIIWYKKNCMPESVKDRPTKSHEYIFLMAKSEKYFYDADAIRETHAIQSIKRAEYKWGGNTDAGKIAPSYAGMKKENMCHPHGRNKRTVWIINTHGFKGSHFATFPKEIPYTCIRAGSRPGDVILDPFAGSGTTLEEAQLLKRDAIGIELKKSYVKNLIQPRLRRLTIMEKEMQKLFAYPGGKWPIRNTIITSFPKHETYIDVFGGAASILIAKDPSKGEVFNDKNEQIVNFFRVVKHRPAELAEKSKHWIHSRTLWNDVRKSDSPVDELERAFKFWVLLADSFGAMGKTFGTSRKGIHSVTHARIHLNLVAERLQDVHVECLDFSRCIKMYDSPTAFFYCDPPYRGTKGGSTNYDQLTDDEWRYMREILGKIKGKFLVSSNADPFVLKLFGKYHIREIDVRVTLSRKKNIESRKEVLISNYELPEEIVPTIKKKPHRARYIGNRGHIRVSHNSIVAKKVEQKSG